MQKNVSTHQVCDKPTAVLTNFAYMGADNVVQLLIAEHKRQKNGKVLSVCLSKKAASLPPARPVQGR